MLVRTGWRIAIIAGEVFPAITTFAQDVVVPNQGETAAWLEMPVETLRSHLSRLRARYRELLRKEVARTFAIADDVDEELRHLCEILIAAA